jgi:hypothetical protein
MTLEACACNASLVNCSVLLCLLMAFPEAKDLMGFLITFAGWYASINLKELAASINGITTHITD